jgi:amidophosphoribosyltransferase
VFNHPLASHLTYLGLYALQHRGQESTGIVVSDKTKLSRYAGMGLVREVFRHLDIIKKLVGPHAIGHNRYSTTGSSTIFNAQPILIDFKAGQLAGAHNGNLVNALLLRKKMEEDGSIFISTTDTEVLMHLIARSKRNGIDQMILDALSNVSGSYSMIFLTKDAMFGARDPRGVRPLLLGKLENAYILSSETCAFDIIGAEMIREILPGEMVRITENSVESFSIPQFSPVRKLGHCIFEFIYFSRPDSFVFGENVDKIRRKLGRQLAKEHPVSAGDFVMGVPDSAITAAIGYSEESRLRYDIGLIRNHYVGRTFILPDQAGRDSGVHMKYNPVKGVLQGKKVVIVDDSIVRGTTIRKIIRLVRSAGPREIHLRISSPPIICPCFYGIDMPDITKLIAHKTDIEAIRNFLEVDSLGYLSIGGMLSVVEGKKNNFCTACFNGDYPIPIDDMEKNRP